MTMKKLDNLHTPKTSKTQETRRKVNPFGGIVPSDMQFKVLKEEEQKRKAEERKETKRTLAQEKVDAKSTKST